MNRYQLTVLMSVVAIAVPAAAVRASGTGTLQLGHVTFKNTWHQVTCPAGTPSSAALCEAMKGQGVVPGLGRANEAYTYVVDDINAASTPVHFLATFVVAGKGELDISAVTPSPVCPCSSDDAVLHFTVTGGTGAYAGAQGSGTVVAGQRSTGASVGWGTDTWTGELIVPGYSFDTAKPVLRGAVPKTVKVRGGKKRVRVTYSVTAVDPDEGRLVVTCAPRSGSYFKLGRTEVECSAIDANGNSAHASFTITVKKV